MATLTTLSDKLKAITALYPADIKQTVFDDLSKVNGDLAEFPLILIKPPVGDYSDRDMNYKILNMDMFAFELELDASYEHWTKTWDKCEDVLVKVLRDLFADTPNYVLVGNVIFTPGHLQHNAKLIGARAQFKLRVFNPC